MGPSATRRIAFGLRTADILQQAGLLPYRNQRPDPRALRLADAGLRRIVSGAEGVFTRVGTNTHQWKTSLPSAEFGMATVYPSRSCCLEPCSMSGLTMFSSVSSVHEVDECLAVSTSSMPCQSARYIPITTKPVVSTRPERRPGDRRQDPGRQVAPPTRPSAGSGAAHREHLLDAGELDSWSSCRVSAATFRGVDPSPGVDVDHRGLSLRDQAIKIRKVSWGLRQKVLVMIVED